jgi:hypothetical protein
MGSIYYHGTTEENAQLILKKGFRKGTYFTWDLHSALVMGGMWVFAVYFEDKDPSKYWEYIIPKPIKKDKILFLRKFDVECIYDNENEEIRTREINFKEYWGKDTVLCKLCQGKGQLNDAPKYGGWGGRDPSYKIEVCNVCAGYGCLKPNGKKMLEE